LSRSSSSASESSKKEETKKQDSEVPKSFSMSLNEEKTKDSKSKTSHKEKKSKDRSRRKSRSRSRSRKRRRRSRDRSRRSRSRDRHHRSKRSRSRKRSRSPRPSKTPQVKAAKILADDVPKFTNLDSMDVSQSLNPIFSEEKLEEQTKERRLRIEQWRMMNALKKAQREEEEGKKKDGDEVKKKKWNLDNDSEDEEENVDAKADMMSTDDESDKKEETKDEIDPLDAFMMGLNGGAQQDGEEAGNGNGPKVRRIVGTTKSDKKVMEKGELMFGNEDAMEYSSEEEDESLGEALSNFQNKQQPRKLEVTVDHSKIHYERFTKNFYIEVPEIAAMTDEEVEHLRNEDLEGVKIKGRNCPRPILQWVHAGVNKKILKILKDLKYEKPTPIQAQAIPAIMAGNDMIGIAKTGSGKTLAFLLPMFRHIMAQRSLDYGDGPIAVIMTPTRELALQIHRECNKFARKNNLKSCCVYGGTGISEQIAELKRGAEIIVCTPGRMIDMLYVNKGTSAVYNATGLPK